MANPALFNYRAAYGLARSMDEAAGPQSIRANSRRFTSDSEKKAAFDYQRHRLGGAGAGFDLGRVGEVRCPF